MPEPATKPFPASRILVIKTGALGDFIQAFGPFQAIRQAHPDAQITLLTGKAFASLGRESGFFDAVMVDPRPKLWQIGAWRAFSRELKAAKFELVYDLQRKTRQKWVWRLLKGPDEPAWSGVFPGCRFYQPDSPADTRHGMDKIREQLSIAGIAEIPPGDLSGLALDVSALPALPERYVLLVPGAAPTRPRKKWPADRYGALACLLRDQGLTPVVVGTEKERADVEAVKAVCPDVIDLCGKTGFGHLVSLAKGAVFAVGNDTGPMHLFAASGCPLLVLYSADSDPAMTLPRGAPASFLQRESLEDLLLEDVAEALNSAAGLGRR